MLSATELVSVGNATGGNTGRDYSATLQTTVINSDCVTKNETTIAHWSNDPLFYIITVLMFYAFSIIILMIKYIRRERQEAEFDNYYYEFVTRDKFQTPQFKNAQNLSSFLKNLQYKKLHCKENQKIENVDNCGKTDTVVTEDNSGNYAGLDSHELELLTKSELYVESMKCNTSDCC